MSQPACFTRLSGKYLVTRDAIIRANTSHPLAHVQNTVAFQISYRLVASRSLFIHFETIKFETLWTTSREPYFYNARIFIAFAFTGVLAHVPD